MYQALYHPYSNPKKSQQKCGDSSTKSDNRKGTFENIEMDNIPRGIKIRVGTTMKAVNLERDSAALKGSRFHKLKMA